jgi:hypothetical protein
MKAPLGKFESNGNYYHVAQYLYSVTGDGGFDEIGSVDELGWYARFDGKIKGRGPFFALLSEHSQGFFDIEWFDDLESLDVAWKGIEEEYENFGHVCDDDCRSNGCHGD